MLFLKNEIQEIIEKHNLNIEQLNEENSIQFRKKIIEKFFDKDSGILWDQPLNDFGFCLRENLAWKWLDSFLLSKDAIIFFDKSDDEILYNIPNSVSKEIFLKEILLYNFYITNKTLDFLIYFNDSSYLRAIGTAEPWLRNKAIELSKTGWRDMDGFYWTEDGEKKKD